MTQTIQLYVNRKPHTLHVDPATPLLYVLRNDLGLKAAKFACGLEQCGACKVLIDGQAVPSCKRTVGSVAGSDIMTLEGLFPAGKYHPIQQAFIDEQAAQCGYCTAGFLVAAFALLEQTPDPDLAEIRSALGRHLCRCGVYDRIVRAVHRAAQEAAS